MEHSSPALSSSISRHAQARMCQRGIKNDDLELIRYFGEQVVDGYLMSDKVVEQCISALKRQLQQLERLRGVALIEGSGCVITVYRADSRRVKRLREGPLKATERADYIF